MMGLEKVAPASNMAIFDIYVKFLGGGLISSLGDFIDNLLTSNDQMVTSQRGM